MKEKIHECIDHPDRLEQLYQSDKKGFTIAFLDLYPEIARHDVAGFWKVRLDYANQKTAKVQAGKVDIIRLVMACVFTGLLIKIPQLFGFDPEASFFYEKNAALVVFFGLSFYAFLSRKVFETWQAVSVLLLFGLTAVYINVLPAHSGSDSIELVYIHLPLMLWCLYGLVFIDFRLKDRSLRMDFIKHNGDLVVLGAVILIAGGLLAGITLGLFYAIDLRIEQFYFDYVIIWGLVSVPIVATFILRTYPNVASKIAPIIARIFTPLVLVTLVVYLISIAVTGKDPYNDRDFLIVFNLMLLGVMALVVFSVSETSDDKKQRFNEAILLALTVVTLLINLVALSAILYRLGEYGFTPNRIAVLGSNLLVFGNLILIMVDLYRINFKNADIKKVEQTISAYLPVYTFWTIFMVFVLPWLIGFR